eukprot:TRINITY_DN14759_c0_g2_i4.p1 TRINITY_DN14759_c0_g2~~TRINITY_DN14759_c0_g2_i4.p1  ORF type:complete len:1229 (+),score=238.52 TRINITY_DN14759_c0_g2_i4:234-3920(+)
MEASSADHEAVLKGWFESFDPNGRGHVKSDDVLSVMGSSFSSDELAKVVEKLDKDDDGMITWDEFKDAFLALIDFPGVDDVDMHAVDNQPTVRASENQNGPQDVAGRHTSRRSRRTRTSIDNPLLNGFLHEAQAARSLRSLREDGVDDESEASSHAGTEVQSRRSSMISIGQQSSVISKQNSVARMASGRVGEHVHELVERCLLAEGKRDQVDQANRQLQRQVDMLQRELERKNVSDGEELHRKIAELDQALRTAKESLSREIDRAVLAEKTMEDMEKQLTEVQSQLEQVTSEKDELATEVEQYTAMLDGMQHEEGDEFGRTYSCPANMPGTTRQFKPGRSRAGSLQEQFIECHPISEEPTDDGLCWQAGFGALDGERLSEVDIASSIAAESNEGAEATEDPEVLRLRTELSGHKLWMEDMEQVIEGLRNTEEKQGVELSQLRKRQQEERERADALQMSLADANKRIEDAETAGRASLSDLCGCLAEERERANALQASLENANQRIEEAEAAGRAALSDACTCLKEERDGRKVPNSVENGGYSTELTSFVLTSDMGSTVDIVGKDTGHRGRLEVCDLKDRMATLLGKVRWRHDGLGDVFSSWARVSEHVGSAVSTKDSVSSRSAIATTEAHPACSSVDTDAFVHDCGSPTAETSRLNNKSLRALDLCLQVQQRRCALDFAFMLWEHNRMGAMNGALENSGAEMTQAHPACSSVDTDAFVHDCGSPTAEALRLNDRSLRALDGCLQVQQRRCALDFAFMLWEKSRMEPMKGALENSAAEITQATSGSADLGHDDAERGRVKSEVVSVSRRSTWSLPALDSFLEARQRRNLLDGVFVFWTQILFELAMQGPLRIADVGPRDVEQDVVDSERARVSSRSTWSLPALDLFLEAQQRRHLLEGVFLLWTRDLCQAMMLDTTLDPRQTEPPEISAAGYCGMVASKEAGLADVLLNQDFTDSQLARASTRKLCPLSGWETFLEAQRAYNILDCAFALWTRIYLETKVVAVENARETKAETRHNDLKMMVVNALWRTRAEQNATFITFMFWGRYSSNEKLQASLQCSEELRQLTGRLNTVFDEELKAISNSVQGVLDSGYGNGAVVTMFDKANSEQLICGCFIMWERAARVSRRRVSFMSDKGSIATSQNGEEKTAERENSHANVLALKSECWRLKRRWASSLDVPKLEIRRLKNKESSALKELASVINGRKSTRSSSFFDKTLLQGKSGHARRSC